MCNQSDVFCLRSTKDLAVLCPLTLRTTEYLKDRNSPKDNFCNERDIITHKKYSITSYYL